MLSVSAGIAKLVTETHPKNKRFHRRIRKSVPRAEKAAREPTCGSRMEVTSPGAGGDQGYLKKHFGLPLTDAERRSLPEPEEAVAVA